jgi:hypothetical protein
MIEEVIYLGSSVRDLKHFGASPSSTSTEWLVVIMDSQLLLVDGSNKQSLLTISMPIGVGGGRLWGVARDYELAHSLRR